MRLGALIPAMILVSSLTAPARADHSSAVPTTSTPATIQHGPMAGKLRVRASRVRRNVSDFDSRVLASLLAMEAPSDFDFEVRAGEVKHADCLASTCNVSLVVERGRNTISVGAADGLLQTAAFVLTSVVATPHLEASNRGRTEWF